MIQVFRITPPILLYLSIILVGSTILRGYPFCLDHLRRLVNTCLASVGSFLSNVRVKHTYMLENSKIHEAHWDKFSPADPINHLRYDAPQWWVLLYTAS